MCVRLQFTSCYETLACSADVGLESFLLVLGGFSFRYLKQSTDVNLGRRNATCKKKKRTGAAVGFFGLAFFFS